MSLHLVIVEKKADWKPNFPDIQVVTAKDYLSLSEYFSLKNAKVINLCRSYRYLSEGYYCSLLAEARQHKIIPSVRTLRDLSSKEIYSLDTESLDELLQKILIKENLQQTQTELEMLIFFGECNIPALKKLAQQLFATFSCPLLKVVFKLDNKWSIYSIKALTLSNLEEKDEAFFIDALNQYTLKKTTTKRHRYNYRYDLAILYNPEDNCAPSDPETLEKMIKIGRKLDINVDLITKKDYSRLAEYDALFIRETTSIEHYTYRFAKKAESEGMVVIDDPNSILRCTNKVYLAELLKANKIPIPNTLILQKDTFSPERIKQTFSYPVVLKIPDGAFSRGVYKVETENELIDISRKLFKESDIILAQEYLYTSFDWRIGILNQKPLFACKYFMSAKHWQIMKHGDNGMYVYGDTETFLVDEAPPHVIKTALKAANLIGNGLYGVDLKETEKGLVVIEINDNPNIEEGFEGIKLGDQLYKIIFKEFIRRIENKQA